MGIGLPELILILVAVLLFVGPKKLPEAGEALGKAFRAFQKGLSGEKEADKPTDVKEAEKVAAEKESDKEANKPAAEDAAIQEAK